MGSEMCIRDRNGMTGPRAKDKVESAGWRDRGGRPADAELRGFWGPPHSHWGGHITCLEGSHYRALKMELLTETLPKLELDWGDRTHFQMRIFLVFGCQDGDLKTVRKMGVLHLQMVNFSASGGGKGPPGILPPARTKVTPKSPKIALSEPNLLILRALDVGRTRKAQIPTPLAEARDGWAPPPVRGPSPSTRMTKA